MARKPSVRYWKSRHAYCTTVHGKQIVLCEGDEDFPDGECYTTALHKFGELVGGKPVGMTLAEVISKYLDWTSAHLAASTARIRHQRLQLLSEQLGRSAVADLTAYTIEAFCDRQRHSRAWGDSTVRLTLTSIRACLNWSVEKGVIASHSVGKFDKPVEASRGLEVVLSPEQEQQVIRTAKGATREFVQVLRDTGARPSEIIRAEAKHFDPQLHALVYQSTARRSEKRHKTIRSGKPRIVYLTGESIAIVQRLVKLHPTGLLFRSNRKRGSGEHKGERWGYSPENVVMIFARLRRKTNIKGLIAYSFRHTFAVRWLRANKPIAALAEVMGTSISLIEKTYGHLCAQHDVLRRLVDL